MKEHDRVILTEDVPSEGLTVGDVGTIVHVHAGGKAFEVEFVSLLGQTAAIATVERRQVRACRQNEIAHARTLAVA
jgi:hypothetical protein